MYGYLIDYHTEWYNTHRDQVSKAGSLYQEDVEEDEEESYRPSKGEELLINHIFGVDIDPGAVEVAKLSLHLKYLEDTALVVEQSCFILMEPSCPTCQRIL